MGSNIDPGEYTQVPEVSAVCTLNIITMHMKNVEVL